MSDENRIGFLLIYVVIGLVGSAFSLYLSYLMLTKIESSDLMWFLFWLVVPISFLTGILNGIVKWMEKP